MGLKTKQRQCKEDDENCNEDGKETWATEPKTREAFCKQQLHDTGGDAKSR